MRAKVAANFAAKALPAFWQRCIAVFAVFSVTLYSKVCGSSSSFLTDLYTLLSGQGHPFFTFAVVLPFQLLYVVNLLASGLKAINGDFVRKVLAPVYVLFIVFGESLLS